MPSGLGRGRRWRGAWGARRPDAHADTPGLGILVFPVGFADIFQNLVAGLAHVLPGEFPRLGQIFRIRDRHLILEDILRQHAHALVDLHVGAVRRAAEAYLFLDPDRIDHQGISLPVAYRVAPEARLGI